VEANSTGGQESRRAVAPSDDDDDDDILPEDVNTKKNHRVVIGLLF
jgi:hypothetical protein